MVNPCWTIYRRHAIPTVSCNDLWLKPSCFLRWLRKTHFSLALFSLRVWQLEPQLCCLWKPQYSLQMDSKEHPNSCVNVCCGIATSHTGRSYSRYCPVSLFNWSYSKVLLSFTFWPINPEVSKVGPTWCVIGVRREIHFDILYMGMVLEVALIHATFKWSTIGSSSIFHYHETQHDRNLVIKFLQQPSLKILLLCIK